VYGRVAVKIRLLFEYCIELLWNANLHSTLACGAQLVCEPCILCHRERSS
jgi:hypothetical protein